MSDSIPRATRPRLVLAAGAAFLFIGCQGGQTTPPQESAAPRDGTSANAPRDETPTVSKPGIRPVDRGGYDRTIEQLHGKVVLADFWATWCQACLEQLPHTAELAQRHQDDGLAAVTIAMADPEDAAQLEQTLASRGADATVNLVSTQGGGSAAMEAFDITGGALPHYKLYDRTGALRHTFALDPSAAEQFTTEDIDSAVQELLAE